MSHFTREGRGYVPGEGKMVNPFNEKGAITNSIIEIKDIAGMLYMHVADEQWNLASKTNKTFELDFRFLEANKAGQNTPWKSTDVIEVFNYNDVLNEWSLGGKVNPNQKNGTWGVKTNISKSGYWIFGNSRKLCGIGPSFSINSEYKDQDIYYYYKVLNLKGQSIRTGYLSLNNGSNLDLNYFPDDTGPIKFQIFDYSDFRGGDQQKVIYESAYKEACVSNKETIAIKLLQKPEPIEVVLVIKCPEGKSIATELLKTQIKTQISAPGKEQWRDLLTFSFENPRIKTYKLSKGSVYDFRISTDGGNTWPYKQNNYTIKEQTWSLDVNADGYCK